MSFNKKFMLLVTALVLIFIPVCSYSSEFYSDGDVIVVLKNSNDDFDSESEDGTLSASSFAETFDAEVVEIFPALSELSGSSYMMLHSDLKDPEEFTKELLKDPDVLAASPNYKVYSSLYPEDTSLNECWGFVGANGINAPEAWEYTQGSNDVYVAIIDSGIDYNNPDLIENIDKAHSRNIINGTSYSATDNYGHGTHVAGIIGAKGDNGMGIAGVNWDVKLISVKALGSNGGGTVAGVISALNYVADLISVQKINIRAVNMSFETYIRREPTYNNLISDPLWRACKDLDKLNKAVMIVAAGNYSETVGKPSTRAHDIVPGAGCYVYPASYKGLNNMISVGALRSDGSLAEFSNRGADMTAPGENILSTWLNSLHNSYYENDGVTLKKESGTSMAAPFVTGAVALLASIAPDDVTAYQLKKAVMGDMSVSSSISSNSETKLRLDTALDLYSENMDDENILPATPPKTEYDSYIAQTTGNSNPATGNNNNNNNNNSDESISGKSGGGCNAGTNIFAAFGLIFLFPLVKKFVS